MKRNRLLTVVGLLLLAITAVSSTIEETEFFKENPLIGGDGRITKSKHFVDGSVSCTQFEIEVTEGGNYFVNFWLLSTQLSDGTFCSYRVKVNDVELPNKIVPVKSGWQSIEIDGNIPVSLKSGLNLVSVIGTVPDVPLVEYIKIGRTNVSAMIDSSEYDSFLSKIKVDSSISVANLDLGDDVFTGDIVEGDVQEVHCIPFDYSSKMDVPLIYTYNGLYYGIKGTRVRFATRSGSSTPHRLCVFNVDDNTISWSSTSNTEHRTDMWVDIPADGYYKIIVRTNTMGTTGVCDVLIYNKYILKDMPISMTRYIVGQKANKTLNTFTAHSSVKSSLWTETGLSGKVLAYNDGYNGAGDYKWGNNARIKKSYDTLVKNVYIAAANSSSPLGKCDLYIGCSVDNTILGYSFPSLKSDDMIRSAGINSEYNCIGWTGGIISWAWPMTEMIEEIKDPKAQLSWFDNFYGKERYPGSPVYTRNGANENNSVIDLWGYVEGSIVSGFIMRDTTAYTHASIRKCLDGIPHGYDWESKCGYLPRIFHPRYSLKGKDYGRVVHYYRPVDNIQKSATIDEVIAEGQAVMENVKLTSGELAIIEDGISKIDGDIILEFGNLFSEWKSLWESNVASNPFILKKHEKYTKLLDFCKDHDSESLRCLVFKMLSDSGMCAMNLVIDLYLSRHRSLMNEIVSYNALNKYDENGAFIIRSPLSQTKTFVKKILGVSSKSYVNVCNETTNYSVDVESVSS